MKDSNEKEFEGDSKLFFFAARGGYLSTLRSLMIRLMVDSFMNSLLPSSSLNCNELIGLP